MQPYTPFQLVGVPFSVSRLAGVRERQRNAPEVSSFRKPTDKTLARMPHKPLCFDAPVVEPT